MTTATAPAPRPRITLERSYDDAAVEDLWALWTTKEGWEAWWGPEGFRVEVQEFDARVGGSLRYDMIADAPDMIEAMREAGRPSSHMTHGTFVEIAPHERLVISHMIDFIPGMEPYEHRMRVEFFRDHGSVRMVLTIDPHRTDELTRLSTLGMESQLTKVPAALAARR